MTYQLHENSKIEMRIIGCISIFQRVVLGWMSFFNGSIWTYKMRCFLTLFFIICQVMDWFDIMLKKSTFELWNLGGDYKIYFYSSSCLQEQFFKEKEYYFTFNSSKKTQQENNSQKWLCFRSVYGRVSRWHNGKTSGKCSQIHVYIPTYGKMKSSKYLQKK